MPIFRFVCTCGARRALVGKASSVIPKKGVSCKVCAKLMTREVGTPGLSVIEELDNQVQPRRTVRYADAEAVWDAHRKAHKAGRE